MTMNLYANAFSSEAGRCFRFVYEPSTSRPMHCPGAVVRRGWWQDNGGYWWAVDACSEHASHLSPARPRPGARSQPATIPDKAEDTDKRTEGRNPRTGRLSRGRLGNT